MNRIIIRIISVFAGVLAIPSVLTAQEKVEYGRGILLGNDQSTAAPGQIGAETIGHKLANDASNSLFGLLPGLQVMQNAGNEWNNSASFFVRGLGTLSAKAPLVLVDGFERSISEISSEEIESVSVLKDAVATSLYGGRGANGVILVRTKRGLNTPPVINFSYSFNLGTPKNIPQMVDGYTYAKAVNEALVNDGLSPRYAQNELEAYRNHTSPDLYPDVDWMKEALRDHSFGENLSFSIRGGGKLTKYYSEIKYIGDRGILGPVNDNQGYSTQFKYSKMNIRTNLDVKLTDKTLLKLNILGNFSEHNRPGTVTGDIFDALYKVPSGVFPVKNQRGVWGGSSVYDNNPIAQISGTGFSRAQGRTLFADLSLTRDLSSWLEGLSSTLKLALDNSSSSWDSNVRKFAYESATPSSEDGKPVYKKLRDETELSFGTKPGFINRHSSLALSLDYSRVVNKEHDIVAKLEYSMDKESSKGQNKSFAYMDIVAFGHYGFKNKYLLDLACSASATSVLDPKNRWGFFPSVGLAWVLSNEDFMRSAWLDLLKLRTSYGMAGSANYGYDLYKAKYGGGNNYYFKNPPASFGGTKEKQLPVEGLVYEKSKTVNIGLDFKAFKSLSLSVDGFYSRRDHILVDDNRVSSTLGITPAKINNGVVDNYGVELAARWERNTGAFRYSIGGNYSFVKNKIIEMNETYRPYDYLKRTGKSLNQIYGYEVIGIYQSRSQIESSKVKQMLSELRPGDYIYKDQNGDNIIDEYDRVPLGYNKLCPEIYYGVDISMEYKGLGVYALFQGVANFSAIMDTKSVFRPIMSNNALSQHYYDNRWTPSNPDAIYPRLTSGGSPNNYANNSAWVTDASFCKLRTLEVYYKLPEKLFASVKWFQGAKIFARGHDLFSLDNVPVFDPESTGVAHPLMKVYNIGFKLSF